MNAAHQKNQSQVLHLVRVTIEAASPLSAASGETVRIERPRMVEGTKRNEKPLEAALVRDANGLPTLPVATSQGVFRHLYAENWGEEEANEVFGFADDEDQGQAGRLLIGFAGVHDSNDKTSVGLVTDYSDPLLKALRDTIGPDEEDGNSLPGRAPLRRDHVKLNERHVVDGRAKFERLAVPIGTRFSFEITMWGKAKQTKQDKATLAAIVDLITYPAFRLGGAARRGYGKIRLVRASYAQANLSDPSATNAVRKLRREPLSQPLAELWYADGTRAPDHSLAPDAPDEHNVLTITLSLKPINSWRVGGLTNKNELVLTEKTQLGISCPAGRLPIATTISTPTSGAGRITAAGTSKPRSGSR
jgi:CRISPR/Cas system CSM-associated protein Csm3 (group 7 of RAMP superfamily)